VAFRLDVAGREERRVRRLLRPPDVLELAGDKIVAVGVIDVASNRIETPDDVRAAIELARRYLDEDRIVCSTNCGMSPMNRDIAYAKLRSLAEGALLASIGL
jgi:5-methyltetrahydropteroyltriglutamate--homocysteine methyltransferase